MWRHAMGQGVAVGLSPLKSLQVLEAADQHEGLEAWSKAFARGFTELLGGLGCHLMRIREEELCSLRAGAQAPVEAHQALLPDAAWAQLQEGGTNALSLSDLGVSAQAVGAVATGAASS